MSAGANKSAAVNIINTDVSGSLVLPAIPMVSYDSLCGRDSNGNPGLK